MSDRPTKMTSAGYCYSFLLRAFPRRVAASYGAEMLDAFVREREYVNRADGSWPAMVFSLQAFADVTKVGLGERWRRSRPGAGRTAPSTGAPGKLPGGRLSLREAFHDVRQDISLALRGLARSPGFTAIAIMSLALGIGINTALFSAISGLFQSMSSAVYPLRYPSYDSFYIVVD